VGTWEAQSVKRLTLDLNSGLDLRVVSSSPTLGSTLGMEPTLKKKCLLYLRQLLTERWQLGGLQRDSLFNKDDRFWTCTLETYISNPVIQISELRYRESVKNGGRFIEVLFLIVYFAERREGLLLSLDSSSKNFVLNFLSGCFYIGFLSVTLTTQLLCAFPSVYVCDH